jgi:hypothetical protein
MMGGDLVIYEPAIYVDWASNIVAMQAGATRDLPLAKIRSLAASPDTTAIAHFAR